METQENRAMFPTDKYPPQHLEDALQAIEACRRSRGDRLNLTDLRFPYLPQELFALADHLEHLVLFNNMLQGDALTNEFGRLANLRTLNISNHEIATIPEGFGNLTRLEGLILHAIYLTGLPETCGRLTSLRKLHVTSNNNSLTSFPAPICDLHGLEELDLTSNRITELPSRIGGLVRLKTLRLGKNDLTGLPYRIGDCTVLEELDASDNQLTSLPASVGNLTRLKRLIARNNLISRLPATVGRLQAVEEIDLAGNRLDCLPKQIVQPARLRSCDFRGNRIQAPITAPFDRNGLLGFIDPDRPCEEPLREARLILVGEGGRGKTTLKHALIRNRVLPSQKTRGIDVDYWPLDPPPGSGLRPVNIDVWDFGGQLLYHQVHQIYLGQQAIYVLVFDTRQDLDVRRQIEGWLETIHTFGKNGPILLVQNQYGSDDLRLDDTFRDYQSRYPSLYGNGVIKVRCLADSKSPCQQSRKRAEECGCETCRGVLSLRKVIADIVFGSGTRPATAEQSDLVHTLDWTQAKQQARNELEILATERDCPLVGTEVAERCCRESGLDEAEVEPFLQDLSGLGHILQFYHTDPLIGHVLLRPEWAKDAVYRLFDHPLMSGRYGHLSRADLAEIWNDGSKRYPAKAHGYLVELMKHYDLAYELEGQPKYVFPAFLSESKPEGVQFDARGATRLVYRYERFFHVSLMTRFIVRMHDHLARHGATDLCWKKGAILSYQETADFPDVETDGARALVEFHDESRTISATVVGRRRLEFIHLIRECFRVINARSEKIVCKELVPCNCRSCRTREVPPNWIPVETLIRCYACREYHLTCYAAPPCKADVRALLSGGHPDEEPAVIPPPGPKPAAPAPETADQAAARIPLEEAERRVRQYLSACPQNKYFSIGKVVKSTGVPRSSVHRTAAWKEYRNRWRAERDGPAAPETADQAAARIPLEEAERRVRRYLSVCPPERRVRIEEVVAVTGVPKSSVHRTAAWNGYREDWLAEHPQQGRKPQFVPVHPDHPDRPTPGDSDARTDDQDAKRDKALKACLRYAPERYVDRIKGLGDEKQAELIHHITYVVDDRETTGLASLKAIIEAVIEQFFDDLNPYGHK